LNRAALPVEVLHQFHAWAGDIAHTHHQGGTADVLVQGAEQLGEWLVFHAGDPLSLQT